MTYLASCNGEQTRVRVVETAPGRYRVTAGDTESLVDFLEPQPDLYSLIVEGRSYEVDVDVLERSDLFRVDINGDHFEVELSDEKKQRLALKSGGSLSGRQEIKAPMAGVVTSLSAREGVPVFAGDQFCLIEAAEEQ